MRFILFLITILLLITCLVGCTSILVMNVTYCDDEIDDQLISSIQNLDDNVIESLLNNDFDRIKAFSTEALTETMESEDIDNMNFSELINNSDFDYINRYYCNSAPVDNRVVTIRTLVDDPFIITYNAKSSDIFVSLLSTQTGINDGMLMLVYIKQNGEWKIDSFLLSDYKYHGMTAVDMYEKAKDLKKQGDLLPALLYMVEYDRLLRPAPNVQYKIEQDMMLFKNEIQKCIRDTMFFPDNINGLQYYGIDIISTQQGLTPEVKYVTAVPIDQTEKIEQEAQKIHDEMIKINTGYEREFHYFLYTAFNEAPKDSSKTYPCYRTLIE